MPVCFWRRAGALALAVLCALTAVGCAADVPAQGPAAGQEAAPPAQEEGDAAAQPYRFTLPWYRGEGYNPYLTDNRLTWQVADLLFEKLVVIDPQGRLEWRVVSGAEVQETALTLRVAPGYLFADGTPVTAADVAASLQAAAGSTLYGGRFAGVQAVRAGEDTVTVTLSQPDRWFCWLLDIPLMPAGETGAAAPRASGRYTYAQEADRLVPNPLYPADAPFEAVYLWEMTGADALANSLNIGAISLYASEEEALANGINSSRQAGYYTNTLVFLGFNAVSEIVWRTVDVDGVESWHSQPTGSAPLLAQPAGRRAVAAMLSRADLLERVYNNRGHAAAGFCNTVGPAAGAGTLSVQAQPDAAAAALRQLGYTLGLDGYYHAAQEGGPAPEPLTLRLLVVSSSSYKRYLAQLIADTLSEGGIRVEVEECPDVETLRQRLTNLDFDMYIGEIKLYNNMDMGAFFSPQGAAAAGLELPEELPALYADWRAGRATTAALEAALAEQMPWAPLLWRSGTLYYDKALQGFTPCASSPFYGMEAVRPADGGKTSPQEKGE